MDGCSPDVWLAAGYGAGALVFAEEPGGPQARIPVFMCSWLWLA